MPKLAADNVHVEGPDGAVVFSRGDDVPEWAARQMGAHCFDDGQHPYPEKADNGDGAGGPPPQAGPKASKDAWTAYAESVGVDVSGCGSRDEIIAAVSEAGHPVE